jgi:hypothetical protein
LKSYEDTSPGNKPGRNPFVVRDPVKLNRPTGFGGNNYKTECKKLVEQTILSRQGRYASAGG